MRNQRLHIISYENLLACEHNTIRACTCHTVIRIVLDDRRIKRGTIQYSQVPNMHVTHIDMNKHVGFFFSFLSNLFQFFCFSLAVAIASKNYF